MDTQQRLDHAKKRLGDVLKQLEYGCGNHGCRIKPPTGQGTNGPCNCNPSRIALRLRDISHEINTFQSWE